MLESIRTKLLILPDETIVYPGHNYGPSPKSTIKQERLFNPFLK
jgi:glyoxylase-like metal-dependent hydrolase (beta-lactamase superfamily II)